MVVDKKYIEKKMNALFIRKKILSILGRNSKNARSAFILSYFHNRWRFPDLKNPKDLSEIWIKRVLDGKIMELAYLADKYAVRDFVTERGLGNILTPLIAVYETADEINFDELPSRFALKANYGAGRNIICFDKSKLDLEQCREKVRMWLKPGVYSFAERHYNQIPKKIVCEEFIDDGTGGFPVDYKFRCIHGKGYCILGVDGREVGHGTYLPYSVEWEPIPEYYRGGEESTAHDLLPRPANLKEMIETAEKLAKGIDLVRVDLYSNGSRIWFGEMTLTPAGCIFHRWTKKALVDMGAEYRRNLS